MEPIRISYFSDVLCVWAYVAQIRLDELKATFQDSISIDYYFTPVFGDTYRKLENRWRDRGGWQGYSNHVRGVAAKFSHITVHPEIWVKNIPYSSMSCHLFLRAIKLVEDKGLLGTDASPQETDASPQKSVFETATWAFREAFFTQLLDISNRTVQFELAQALGLPLDAIKEEIDSGAAYADLSRDLELMREHSVNISPTLIFNEGRQRLNGNVGYRVIEANIRELLHNPPDEQSWC